MSYHSPIFIGMVLSITALPYEFCATKTYGKYVTLSPSVPEAPLMKPRAEPALAPHEKALFQRMASAAETELPSSRTRATTVSSLPWCCSPSKARLEYQHCGVVPFMRVSQGKRSAVPRTVRF